MKRMPFTGEKVLAGKGGAFRNVFSNSGRSDTAYQTRRSCSLVEAVLRREPLPTEKVFSPKGGIWGA